MHAIKIAMEALVLSIFPPMYFFAHVYYTDILSITMTLALINFQIKQNHYYATIFGMDDIFFHYSCTWATVKVNEITIFFIHLQVT